MPNFGSWAGRLQAVLGAPGGTSALPVNPSPNLQNISRARVRLFDVYSLTTFIRLHAELGSFLEARIGRPTELLVSLWPPIHRPRLEGVVQRNVHELMTLRVNDD
jgi:hypothetical protein